MLGRWGFRLGHNCETFIIFDYNVIVNSENEPPSAQLLILPVFLRAKVGTRGRQY